MRKSAVSTRAEIASGKPKSVAVVNGRGRPMPRATSKSSIGDKFKSDLTRAAPASPSFHTWDKGADDSDEEDEEDGPINEGPKYKASDAIIIQQMTENKQNRVEYVYSDSEEEKEGKKEQDDEGKGDDDIPQNPNAPKLVLKDLLTPEQIRAKEKTFTDLLQRVKIALKTSVFDFEEVKSVFADSEADYQLAREQEERAEREQRMQRAHEAQGQLLAQKLDSQSSRAVIGPLPSAPLNNNSDTQSPRTIETDVSQFSRSQRAQKLSDEDPSATSPHMPVSEPIHTVIASTSSANRTPASAIAPKSNVSVASKPQTVKKEGLADDVSVGSQRSSAVKKMSSVKAKYRHLLSQSQPNAQSTVVSELSLARGLESTQSLDFDSLCITKNQKERAFLVTSETTESVAVPEAVVDTGNKRKAEVEINNKRNAEVQQSQRGIGFDPRLGDRSTADLDEDGEDEEEVFSLDVDAESTALLMGEEANRLARDLQREQRQHSLLISANLNLHQATLSMDSKTPRRDDTVVVRAHSVPNLLLDVRRSQLMLAPSSRSNADDEQLRGERFANAQYPVAALRVSASPMLSTGREEQLSDESFAALERKIRALCHHTPRDETHVPIR